MKQGDLVHYLSLTHLVIAPVAARPSRYVVAAPQLPLGSRVAPPGDFGPWLGGGPSNDSTDYRVEFEVSALGTSSSRAAHGFRGRAAAQDAGRRTARVRPTFGAH